MPPSSANAQNRNAPGDAEDCTVAPYSAFTNAFPSVINAIITAGTKKNINIVLNALTAICAGVPSALSLVMLRMIINTVKITKSIVASIAETRKANPILSLKSKYDKKSLSSPAKLIVSIPHSLFAQSIRPSISLNNVLEIIYKNSQNQSNMF